MAEDPQAELKASLTKQGYKVHPSEWGPGLSKVYGDLMKHARQGDYTSYFSNPERTVLDGVRSLRESVIEMAARECLVLSVAKVNDTLRFGADWIDRATKNKYNIKAGVDKFLDERAADAKLKESAAYQILTGEFTRA